MNRNDFLKAASSITAAILVIPKSVSANVKSIVSVLNPKIVRANQGKTVNVIGDMQTFKLTGKDTNGLFTLIEEENDPGTGIPPHVHDNEDEVFKVLEGQMELTVGDKKAKVILSAFPAGIEDMFEELGALPPGPPDFPKVAEICGRFGIRFIQ